MKIINRNTIRYSQTFDCILKWQILSLVIGVGIDRSFKGKEGLGGEIHEVEVGLRLSVVFLPVSLAASPGPECFVTDCTVVETVCLCSLLIISPLSKPTFNLLSTEV